MKSTTFDRTTDKTWCPFVFEMFSKHLNGNKKEIEEKEKVCKDMGGQPQSLNLKKVYITGKRGFKMDIFTTRMCFGKF